MKPGRKPRTWTDEELALLRSGLLPTVIAKKLHVCPPTVRRKMDALGIKRRRNDMEPVAPDEDLPKRKETDFGSDQAYYGDDGLPSA